MKGAASDHHIRSPGRPGPRLPALPQAPQAVRAAAERPRPRGRRAAAPGRPAPRPAGRAGLGVPAMSTYKHKVIVQRGSTGFHLAMVVLTGGAWLLVWPFCRRTYVITRMVSDGR